MKLTLAGAMACALALALTPAAQAAEALTFNGPITLPTGVAATGQVVVTATTPLPTGPGPTATTTDKSITVATGGTAQVVMAANTSRRSFYMFNPNSSGTCWGSFTTATPSANALGSFPIPSLGGFGMETSPTTNALYVNCPTTGQFLTAWESQ